MSTEKKEAPGRDWGDVLADIGVGALRGYGRGGVRGAIAGGIVGGIEGDKDAERQQLEMENARLRNEALKQDLRFGKNREERAAAAEKRSEQASKRAEQSHAVSMQHANASLEASRLNLYKAQAQAYGDEFYKGMTNKLNADGVDFADQNLLFNSTAFREAQDMWIAFKMYDNNPDAAVSLLKDIGWNVETDKDGKTWFYQDAPDGTRKRLEFNDATVRQIRDKVNKDFMDNYGTVIALGTPAASLNQASIKNVLTSKEVKNVYGDKLLDAGRDYKAFLQAGAKSKIFTQEDIAGHIMNRTLQAALVDKKLTQEEMQVLIPQFQLALKKFGGEIIPGEGGSIEKTLVKLKDGRTITLDTLARDLNERDVVWGKWNDQMKAKAVAKEAAMIKRANDALNQQMKIVDLETKQLKNREKRQEMGLPVDGGGAPGESDEGIALEDALKDMDGYERPYKNDGTHSPLVIPGLNAGHNFVKKYDIKISNPNRELALFSLGDADLAAEDAYSKTGFYFEAERAFYASFGKELKDERGNAKALSNSDGSCPFLTTNSGKHPVLWFSTPQARKADMEEIEKIRKTNPEEADRLSTLLAVANGDLRVEISRGSEKKDSETPIASRLYINEVEKQAKKQTKNAEHVRETYKGWGR